jgi:hypothetical protein
LTYQTDYGMVLVEIARRHNDVVMGQQGIAYLWAGFEGNRNNAMAFRKLVTTLGQSGNMADARKAAQEFAEYKINLGDSYVQRLLGIPPPSGLQIPDE